MRSSVLVIQGLIPAVTFRSTFPTRAMPEPQGYTPGWMIRRDGHPPRKPLTAPLYSCELKSLGRGRFAVRVTHNETGIRAVSNEPVEHEVDNDAWYDESPNILGQIRVALELTRGYVEEMEIIFQN